MSLSTDDLTQVEKHLKAEYVIVRKGTFVVILAMSGLTTLTGAWGSAKLYMNTTAEKVAKDEIKKIHKEAKDYWRGINSNHTLPADLRIEGSLTVNGKLSIASANPEAEGNRILLQVDDTGSHITAIHSSGYQSRLHARGSRSDMFLGKSASENYVTAWASANEKYERGVAKIFVKGTVEAQKAEIRIAEGERMELHPQEMNFKTAGGTAKGKITSDCNCSN